MQPPDGYVRDSQIAFPCISLPAISLVASSVHSSIIRSFRQPTVNGRGPGRSDLAVGSNFDHDMQLFNINGLSLGEIVGELTGELSECMEPRFSVI